MLLTQQQQYGIPKYHAGRDQYIATLPVDSNSIVFLGNSLTQYFELAEHFGNQHVKNRGIGGDNLPGLLSRLSPVIQGQPKKIFIEIGGNDLRAGIKPEAAFLNFQKLIDTLQRSCLRTKIYVQSVLPVVNNADSLQNDSLNKSIIALNGMLLKHCSARNLFFVDPHKLFVLNDKVQADYFVADGIHVSAKGYHKWAEILRPLLKD